MKVVVVGGGPGGLYLAGLLRERRPQVEVEVHERNAADETFGFGVVFSRPTLDRLRAADPDGFPGLFGDAVTWPGIDIVIGGERWRCEGNGFAAIERRRLLALLTARADAAGVSLHYHSDLQPGSPELAGADVVVVANGANTVWRRLAAARLGATTTTASARFIWLAATRPLQGMTFLFERSDHGWFAVHGYPYSDRRSTFVVETDTATWRAAGLDAFDTTQAPGPSDERSRVYLQRLFGRHLDGAELVGNSSRWASFQTVRTADWVVDERTVLVGDAAHTAHFSVGSGTKMALDDAVVLSDRISHVVDGAATVPQALQSYQDERRRDVRRIQDLARPSLAWWENFREYAELPVPQFAYHFLTRSGSVTRARLAAADPAFLRRCLDRQVGVGRRTVLDTPLTLVGGDRLGGRVVALADPTSTPGASDLPRTPDLRIPGLRIPRLCGPGATEAPATAQPTTIDGRAAVWLRAPAAPEAVEDLVADAAGDLAPGTVVLVEAGPEGDDEAWHAQLRTAEVLRLRHRLPVAVVLPDADADLASSLVLAGRADLVAAPPAVAGALAADERRLVGA